MGQTVTFNAIPNKIDVKYGKFHIDKNLKKESETMKCIVDRDNLLEYLDFNEWFDIHTDARNL